jgi:hypothetical protein
MKNSAHYIKILSLQSHLLIFHFMIHRDFSENRDLRSSRDFFFWSSCLRVSLSFRSDLIRIAYSFSCSLIFWLSRKSINIKEIISTWINYLDWMIVKRLDAKSTNWWRIDDTNRFKSADAIRNRIVHAWRMQWWCNEIKFN